MFLNFTMLAGLAGAMLPLVLHLLSRARYRKVQWGAMMFLSRADGRQSRRLMVMESVLLLIRMGMVAMLAIALARPVLGPANASSESPACTVIFLDHSASMGADENGPSRMESGRRAVVEVLSNLRRGDEAAFVQFPDAGTAVPSLTTDLQQLASRIPQARAYDGRSTDALRANGRADIAVALTSAAKILEGSNAPFKHIVLIADQQAANWKQVQGAFIRNWRASVTDSSGRLPKLTVISIGSQENANAAVESVQVANPPVVSGTVADIAVQLRNYDTVPCANLPLTIVSGSDSRELYRATVTLDAGQSETFHCPVVFKATGPQFITAKIDGGGLSMDDSMEAAVEVVDPIRVLIVNGEESASGSPSGSADFVRVALSPFGSSERAGADLAGVEVVSSDDWPTLDRGRWRVVVLADVPRVTSEQVQQLEQFVYGGGGLIISPGNLVRMDDYDSQLWRDGAGLLPAELEQLAAADGSESTVLSSLDLSHPILGFLKGREEPVPRIGVARYFKVRNVQPQGKVLGRYASGSPFLIENSYGRGRVLMFTLSLGSDWSSLPLASTFLPLMQSSVRYLSAATLPDRNLSLGEPIIAMIDNPSDSIATLESSQPSVTTTVNLLRIGDGYEARFSNASRPGQYRMRVNTARGPRQIAFAVRPSREESDLTSLTAQQWSALQTSLGFERIEAEPQAIADAVAAARRRRELWPWLLGGVFMLAFVELALARAWSGDHLEEAA